MILLNYTLLPFHFYQEELFMDISVLLIGVVAILAGIIVFKVACEWVKLIRLLTEIRDRLPEPSPKK